MADKTGYPPYPQAMPQPYEQQPQPTAYPPPYDANTQAPPYGQHPQYMPQGQPQYVPPVQQQPIITQSVFVQPQVGPDPTMTTCPSCRSNIVTRMEYNATGRTHLFALLLCVFGCWPCVCLPYCMDSCQDGNHYCPSCGAYIGTYHQ